MMTQQRHNAPNPLYQQLFDSGGAVGMKVATKEIEHIRSGMYRKGYKVVVVSKGKRISIIDVVKR